MYSLVQTRMNAGLRLLDALLGERYMSIVQTGKGALLPSAVTCMA